MVKPRKTMDLRSVGELPDGLRPDRQAGCKAGSPVYHVARLPKGGGLLAPGETWRSECDPHTMNGGSLRTLEELADDRSMVNRLCLRCAEVAGR